MKDNVQAKMNLRRDINLRHMVVEDNDELLACYHNSVHKEKILHCSKVKR
jgi:hypothetical protein